MKRWKRQNRIQKYGRSIYEFFKPAKMAYQFETYKPKINRKRLVLGTAFIGFCIATPVTNVMIPSTVRWMVR